MPDIFFLSASGADLVYELQASFGGERVLWHGRCAVAEYAFSEPASLPRWTLPEETEVVVTETRVAFLDPYGQTGGELHWPWPQHLRVQPGNGLVGRAGTVTQVQLVCGGPDGAFPALVFAGGDLKAAGQADRLANVLRQSIARFRVEYAADLGLAVPSVRVLSRQVIGPEFTTRTGGEGQTVSLLGAIAIDRPVDLRPPAEPRPVESRPAEPRPAEPTRAAEPARPNDPWATGDWAYGERTYGERGYGERPSNDRNHAEPRSDPYEGRTVNLSAFLAPTAGPGAPVVPGTADGGPEPTGQPNDDATDRAAAIRRTASRFAGNSARARGTARQPTAASAASPENPASS